MQTIAAGPPLVELLTIAYRADLSVMLHGDHGVGKSTMMAAAAKCLGIDYLELDLSIMEPPDLVGIPHVDGDGRTVYAAPAFLPRAGKGIMMIEELNRSPRHMQGPCLQLLTARRLNTFVLPAGWLPCAAINDGESGYLVEDLDAALLSRFVNVAVVAEVSSWVAWARSAGVHEKVIAFVRNSPGIFGDPQSNPRAWQYVSHFLFSWETGNRQQELLATALAGLVGDKWALAFVRAYADERQPLEPAEILDDYAVHRSTLKSWVKECKLDVVVATLEKLKQFLQPQFAYNAVVANAGNKKNVEMFFADLPPDIKLQVRSWLDDRGFHGLSVKLRAKGAQP